MNRSSTSHRKRAYRLRIELEGYEPYEVRIDRKIDGWFWANLLFNGGMRMLIDAATGAMFRLSPDRVVAQLQRAGGEARYDGDALYLFVALEPDSAGEPVGWLKESPWP